MSLQLSIKKTIKSDINAVYEIYTFDQILSELYNKLKITYPELKYSLLKQIVSSYASVSNSQLYINTKDPSKLSYDDIKNIIRQTQLKIDSKQQILPEFGPYGTDWVHSIQVDDHVKSSRIKKRSSIFDSLSSVEYPAQRSPEWYAQRDLKITASDIGTCLGEDKYNQPYYVIVKKMRETFSSNINTYHGKKFEQIATSIYEYRMNVKTKEFGLCHHSKYSFLGASPDGIVSKYKLNEQNLTKFVGRMLEIKCPTTRKINMSGEIKGEICPIHYWDQVQIQLECCELDECDFWQCNLQEYSSEVEFYEDTLIEEPFRSKKTGFEKGCLIQLLPSDKIVYNDDSSYNEIVYGHSIHIYPPHVEMTPYDCLRWIEHTKKELARTHPSYQIDKIIYWYLKESYNVTIKRDKKWFRQNIGSLEKMWGRIQFVRADDRLKKIFLSYVDNYLVEHKNYFDKKNNEEKKNIFLMEMIDTLIKLKSNNSNNFNNSNNSNIFNNSYEEELTRLASNIEKLKKVLKKN
jgi:putative phage-type endonuclease